MPPKPILLIEDDPDYAAIVSEVLASAEERFDLKSAPTLSAGVALLDTFQPELILVDLNLPDSAGYETFLRIQEQAGGVPIVLLTGLDDDHIAVQAVQDGAQDYLVKNLIEPRLIARCVNMAVSRHRRQAPYKKTGRPGQGTVLSFIGSKGGVGTSTTAINVAALMAGNGMDAVAIELQFGRPSTFSIYLYSEPRYDLSSLCEKAPDTITSMDLKKILADNVAGLRLLCPSLAAGSGQTFGAERVRAIVAAARQAFRFVVLDLPPHVDEAVEQALKISDSVTLIVDRETSAVHCAVALMQHIRTLISQTKDVGVAIVDRSGREAPPLAEINTLLKAHPLALIPSAAPAIALSQSARTPLVLLCPDDPFSSSHFDLAERLLASTSCADFPVKDRQVLSRTTVRRVIPEATYY